MPQANQHKPTPPLDEIAPHIFRYFRMRKPVPEILSLLEDNDHYDKNRYGLKLSSLKTKMKALGLQGTRKQAHTVETITPLLLEVRVKFPTVGAREIINILSIQYGVRVTRDVVRMWCRENEPDAVEARRMKRFVRRRCYAAGIDHVWAFDQHDKWRRFNLYLHIGIDVASRKILWLVVWSSNSNPRLISKYYFDAVEELGGVPLLTQSDLGTENYGIANAQTSIRQYLDPELQGTLQHRWMRGHDNVKPEIAWSQFRRRFSPGFEDALQAGVDNDIYNPNDNLHEMVFHYLAIPWMQGELDAYVLRYNSSKPRFNRNRIGAHDAPDLVYENPNRYDTVSFKIDVPKHVVDEARKQWAPPDHEIFKLAPSSFTEMADVLYNSMGSPPIAIDTLWAVFRQLLQRFLALSNERPDAVRSFRDGQREAFDREQAARHNGYYPLLQGQLDWADNNGAFGGGQVDVENTGVRTVQVGMNTVQIDDDDDEDLYAFLGDEIDEIDEAHDMY